MFFYWHPGGASSMRKSACCKAATRTGTKNKSNRERGTQNKKRKRITSNKENNMTIGKNDNCRRGHKNHRPPSSRAAPPACHVPVQPAPAARRHTAPRCLPDTRAVCGPHTTTTARRPTPPPQRAGPHHDHSAPAREQKWSEKNVEAPPRGLKRVSQRSPGLVTDGGGGWSPFPILAASKKPPGWGREENRKCLQSLKDFPPSPILAASTSKIR